MSEDETLRMAAQVVDKFSAPIRDMQRSLRNLSDQVKNTHKAGTDQAKDHAKAFGNLHHSIRDVSERVRGALNPAMAAFGVGAISAAGGIAAVAAAIKDFAGTSRQLSNVSKEVGLSIQQLRVYEALANRVGSSGAAMDAGLENFAKNMEELRRNRGELQQFFVGQMAPGVRVLGDELRHTTDNATAFRDVLEALGHVQGPDAEVQKRNLLEKFGLPLELARKSGQELKDLLAELNRSIGTLSAEQIRKGQEAEDGFDRLRESAGRLKNEIGAGLAPAVTRMTDALRQFVEENRDSLVRVLDDVGKAIEGADWKGFADGAKEAAGGVRMILRLKDELGEAKINWDDVLNTAGMTASFDGFKTYWELQWSNLKDIFGNGNKESPETKALRDKLQGLDRSSETKALRDRLGLNGPEQHQNPDATEKATRKGVKDGFLDGLREGFHRESFIGNGVGGGSVIRASYGGGLGGLWGSPMGGAGGGAVGGGGGADAVRRALQGGGWDAGGGGGDPSLTGNAFLQSQRARFAQELKKNPQTRAELAAVAMTEDSHHPAAVIESLMNRMAMTGGTIHGGLHSGFYGPINRGALPGAMASLDRNPKQRAAMQSAIDQVLGGSNILEGATDQGMLSDPNGRWQGGRKFIGGEVFNDWGGGPGGHAGAARFRLAQQAQVLAATHRNAFIAAARAARARVPRGGQSSSSDLHADLLGSARNAGMIGQSHKVTGEASLRIDLNNFPRGTRTATGMNGMFKEVRLNRGRVPYADQEG